MGELTVYINKTLTESVVKEIFIHCSFHHIVIVLEMISGVSFAALLLKFHDVPSGFPAE